MALIETVPQKVATPSSSGRRASGRVVGAIEVFPTSPTSSVDPTPAAKSSHSDVTWTVFLSDEPISETSWSISLWLSDASLKLECMKANDRTGSIFRVSNVFNKYDLVQIGFNPRYSIELIAKMIESSLHSISDDSHSPSHIYRRTCMIRILDKNGMEIENSESSADDKYGDSLVSEKSYMNYHTIILILMENDIELFEYKFIFRKNELLLLSDELLLSKQKIIELEKQLYQFTQINQQLKESNELLIIKYKQEINEINIKKDNQINQLLLEIKRMKKEYKTLERQKNAEIERLTLDLGEMVEALEHATTDMILNNSKELDEESILYLDSSVSEIKKDDLVTAKIKNDYTFDDSTDKFDREIYSIKEEGKLLTHSGAWDWHCTYIKSSCMIIEQPDLLASPKGISVGGGGIDEMSEPMIIKESVDLFINVSKYNDLMFGVTELNENRTKGFFGDPLKGIGYYALYGSLYCPGGKCLTPFADPSKSGDIIRINVEVNFTLKQATLSFCKINNDNGFINPLGSPIDLEGLLDWNRGLKFVIVSCNTGDQIRIL